jgi:hypothetical protein
VRERVRGRERGGRVKEGGREREKDEGEVRERGQERGGREE